MEGFLFWLNLLLGGTALLVWGWVAALNWCWVWRGVRGLASGSPVLLAGPIFSAMALGCWVRSGVGLSGVALWFCLLGFWIFDPGALPLVVAGLWRRFCSDSLGCSKKGE